MTAASESPQKSPPPTWAVALDKMRAEDGGRPDDDVLLSPVEAQAFVEHYLETSRQLDQAAEALTSIGVLVTAGLRGY